MLDSRWVRALAGAGAVIGLGLVLWALFGGASDDERIRRCLAEFAATASVPEPVANPVIRALALRGELAATTEDTVRVEIPELDANSTGRDELARVLAQASTLVQTAEVGFTRIEVVLEPARTRATANVVASVRLVRRDGSREQDDRRARFELVREGRRWRIASIRVFSPDEEEAAAE